MSNICLFSRAFYPDIGGLERMALILAFQATKIGHQVEVVTDTHALSELDDQQFPFRVIRTREYKERASAFKRSDAILFMNMSLHGLVAAINTRAPVILSHHGIYGGNGILGRALAFLKRFLTRFFTNISVSHYVAQNISGASVIIHNAYDSGLFTQPVNLVRTRDFVFCGRLVSDKGVDFCLRAFAFVLQRVPQSTMTVIGDGPERHYLRDLVKELGISGQVHFAGSMKGDGLSAELQRHACMVVPSQVDEGFGITALEGIACCDTVIVTRRGGLPEAVGDCGLVVESTIEDLGAAMLAVAQARSTGAEPPWKPESQVRAAHLSLHEPMLVSQGYLDVIAKAIRRRIKL